MFNPEDKVICDGIIYTISKVITTESEIKYKIYGHKGTYPEKMFKLVQKKKIKINLNNKDLF